MSYKNGLGAEFRLRRKQLGLKVQDVAKEVGVHPVYITQIEKHNKSCSDDVLRRILHVLKLGKIVTCPHCNGDGKSVEVMEPWNG